MKDIKSILLDNLEDIIVVVKGGNILNKDLESFYLGDYIILTTSRNRILGVGKVKELNNDLIKFDNYINSKGVKFSSDYLINDISLYRFYSLREVLKELINMGKLDYTMEELDNLLSDDDLEDFMSDYFQQTSADGGEDQEDQGGWYDVEDDIEDAIGDEYIEGMSEGDLDVLDDYHKDYGEDYVQEEVITERGKRGGKRGGKKGVGKGKQEVLNMEQEKVDTREMGDIEDIYNMKGLDMDRLEKVLKVLGDNLVSELKGYGVDAEKIYRVVADIIGNVKNMLIKEFDID